MEDEVLLYLKRFASVKAGKKKILLQLSNSCTGLSLMCAAWTDGWTVAIIREDAPTNHLKDLRAKLGAHLHFVIHENPLDSFVDTGRSTESLGDWLSGEKNEVEPCSLPYLWDKDECALILFTTGSTGIPKGVCHSLGNLMRSARLFVEHFNLSDDDHLFCLAPPHSMSGLRSTILPLVTRAQVSMLSDKDASFFSIIDEIRKLRPTYIICGPVFVKQLAAYGKRVSEPFAGVDALLCTGADLDEADRKAVESDLSIPVVNYYGLTETSGIVLAETLLDRNPHFLPSPCYGVSIVLTPVEKTIDTFHLGIQSPNLFLGYLGEPLSRKRSFDTCDIVQKEPDGQLRLKGRGSGSRAVKAPNTEWVFPDLLERWLKGREDIMDAVVKPLRVVGGYGLEVWADGTSDLDPDDIADSIVVELGQEHRPVKWHRASIKRNQLGRVEQIIDNEECDGV